MPKFPVSVLSNSKSSDNLFKSILDGFKGIVYNDDEQVIGIVAFKRNFDKRKIEIWIWEVLR